VFTGIVEERGVLEKVTGSGLASRLWIRAETVLDDVRLGDSIAVNGVCLTVTSFTSRHFTADVMPETLKKTSLGRLKPGEILNLERAMRLGDRFGGHIVTGHVDGIGEVVSRHPHGNAVLFRIKTEAPLLRYMIPRGSVTVDGISLTLVDVGDADFAISIIPHTLSHTNLQEKRPGDLVNLECDIIGKYVERLAAKGESGRESSPAQHGLTLAMLQENGYC